MDRDAAVARARREIARDTSNAGLVVVTPIRRSVGAVDAVLLTACLLVAAVLALAIA